MEGCDSYLEKRGQGLSLGFCYKSCISSQTLNFTLNLKIHVVGHNRKHMEQRNWIPPIQTQGLNLSCNSENSAGSINLWCLFLMCENGNSNSSHFIGVVENSQWSAPRKDLCYSKQQNGTWQSLLGQKGWWPHVGRHNLPPYTSLILVGIEWRC